jgi:prepilin-type N-terminal cleavage/methylation domain-containing protein/prepilin-type processing-associated H-X9-DG protein
MSRLHGHRGRAAKRGKAGWANQGFTIIELLVVIGIAVLLVAMLLPALNKAHQQANSLCCQTKLEQIGEAIQNYLGVSHGVLPFGYWDGTFNPQTGVDHGMIAKSAADWTQLLQRNVYNNSPATLQAKVRDLFFDPDAPQAATLNALGLTLVQYACHPRLMPLMGTEDKYAELNSGGAKCYLRPYKIAKVAHCSAIALIFDASLTGVAGGGYSVLSEPVGFELDDGRITTDTFLTDQYNLATTPGFAASQSVDMTPATAGGPVNSDDPRNPQNIRFRHMNNRICNALMVDFHVESFTWTATGGTDLQRLNINVNP